jgi:hypothetical protein
LKKYNRLLESELSFGEEALEPHRPIDVLSSFHGAGRRQQEEPMAKSRIAVSATIAIVSALAAAASVRAGSEKIEFPNDYARGVVYKTEDRPDNKQVRELFITPQAVEAVRRGAPLPSGTVITSVRYAAQIDAQGNATKDANGRFIKTDQVVGYTVKEKRAGWGAEYPEEARNGEWEYRVFRADKTANPDTKYDGCFTCHKSQESQDYLFTYDSLKAASR